MAAEFRVEKQMASYYDFLTNKSFYILNIVLYVFGFINSKYVFKFGSNFVPV